MVGLVRMNKKNLKLSIKMDGRMVKIQEQKE